MIADIDYFRQFNFVSVLVRLLLAVLFGGLIGLERGLKHRAAGFRTYMLVCLGASMTMLIGQYEGAYLETFWTGESVPHTKIDVTRFGAQVINGIGFLGAGTILLNDKQEVKGLTTAAGLWASGCMGLVIGAGYYECAVLAFVLIMLCMCVLPSIEAYIVEHARDVNLYIEFRLLGEFGEVIACIKKMEVKIYGIEISQGQEEYVVRPSANLMLRLPRGGRRERLIAELSKDETVLAVREI